MAYNITIIRIGVKHPQFVFGKDLGHFIEVGGGALLLTTVHVSRTHMWTPKSGWLSFHTRFLLLQV